MMPLALLFLLFATTAASALPCQDKPGDLKHKWSWREVDGKRCWFELPADGRQPSKSDLQWIRPHREIREEKTEAPAAEKSEAIEVLHSRAAVHSDVAANWFSDAPIDLMSREPLAGPAGVGWWLIIPAAEPHIVEKTSENLHRPANAR